MLVYIQHPSLGPQKTRLSADIAKSATTSTVENNQGFATDDYVVIGTLGNEKTEIVKITSTSGNTTLGHTAGTSFAHSARDQISQIKYNQAKIYTSTTETGTYTLLTTITELDVDEDYTVYDDTTGTDDTWYKVKYYNDVTTGLSSFSSAVQGVGYTEESLYSMVDEVLEDFGDIDSREISRKRVRTYLRAGVRRLTLSLIKVLPDYRRNYTTQTLTTSETYDLPTRFLEFVRVDVNYDGTTATEAYKATFESEADGQPDTDYSTSDPRIFFRGDQFGLRPTPTTGMAFLWYWDYPSVMTDDSDTHGLPHGAREPLIAYALYRLWASKDRKTASVYKSEFRDAKREWLDFVVQKRQAYSNNKILISFGQDLYSEQ